MQPPTALTINKAKLSDVKEADALHSGKVTFRKVIKVSIRNKIEIDADSAHEEQETDEDTDPVEPSAVFPEHVELAKPTKPDGIIYRRRTEISTHPSPPGVRFHRTLIPLV